MSALRQWLLFVLLASFGAGAAAAQSRGPLVLSASSVQEAMTEAANAWAALGHARPVLSFAGSPALARQIETGAPADLFVSADEAWMTSVERKGWLRAGTRTRLVSNRMVLIAPASSKTRLTIGRNFPLARALGTGRLAMADPDAVPAGRYGKAALESLGAWPSVRKNVVRAENVRAALALVARGESAMGIVYATDARATSGIRIIGMFPAQSHPAISYPLALLRTSRHRDADAFRRFLISRAGKAIFARHGFTTL